MSEPSPVEGVVTIDPAAGLWGRTFTVAPLVVIGTVEGDHYDLAPKHMAFPIGWTDYFGFVCSPRHATYHNARHAGTFTVTYPRPEQVVMASLAAAPRHGWEGEKPIVGALPTFSASKIDGVFLKDGYFFLECELDRVVDGFGESSIITGRVVAAHVHEDALIVSEESAAKLLGKAPLLVYVDPGRYATLRKSHAFPFPSGLSR